jgi:hypothetical protein
MANEPIKNLHLLIGKVILPHGSKGMVSPTLSVGMQLFKTMNTLHEASIEELPGLLDTVADELQLARTVNLINEATLNEALGYIEEAKQNLGV